MSLTLNESFWSRDVLTYARVLVLSLSTLLVVTAGLLPGALDYAEKECHKQTKVSYYDCLQRNYDYILTLGFWVLMMIPSLIIGMLVWFLIPSLPESKPTSRSAI